MDFLWNLIWIFNYSALILATVSGCIEIVELLLKQEEIDINSKTIWNHKKFIEFKSNFFNYIENFINYMELFKLKHLNYTSLIYAASGGHTKIVDLLLKQEGIDFDFKDI